MANEREQWGAHERTMKRAEHSEGAQRTAHGMQHTAQRSSEDAAFGLCSWFSTANNDDSGHTLQHYDPPIKRIH